MCGGATHQLRVRSQGSLLVASGQWAATPQRCQEGYRELREAHDRTTARWPAAPWMLARASAKRMRCQCGFHESHSLARCSARAHIRAPSASVCEAKALPAWENAKTQKGSAAHSVRDRFTAPLRSGRIKSHVSHVSYVSHNAPRPLVPLVVFVPYLIYRALSTFNC